MPLYMPAFYRLLFSFSPSLGTYIYIYLFYCLLCVFAGSFSFCFILLVFNYLIYFLHIFNVLFCCVSVICKDMIFLICFYCQKLPFLRLFFAILQHFLSVNKS